MSGPGCVPINVYLQMQSVGEICLGGHGMLALVTPHRDRSVFEPRQPDLEDRVFNLLGANSALALSQKAEN